MKKALSLIYVLLLSLALTFSLSACDKGSEKEDKDNKKHTHSFGEWIEKVPATCTNEGTLGHYTCSGCKKNFDADKNELSSLSITKNENAHNFVDESCTECGKKIVYSEGLAFELVNDEYYKVTGIGTCTDTELYIPKNYNALPVKEIERYAFYDNGSLVSVTIPDSVTVIGHYAFRDCNSLTSVVTGNGVTDIGSCAFVSCKNLTTVIIGNKVASFGAAAFSGCESLTSITVDVNNPYFKDIDGNLYSKDGKTLVQYALGKADTSFIIPNGVERIGVYAVAFSGNLESISISDDVAIIEEGSFACCENLKNVTIGNNVASIGSGAFGECPSLTSIKYRGSEEAWNAISKASDWDYYTGDYTITFNCSGN